MSRVRSPRAFKQWVRAQMVEPELAAVDELCRLVFTIDGATPDQVRTLTRWLRLFAAEFLEADAYNAAKHGLALSGASEQWIFQVAGHTLLGHDGASLTWLSTRPDEEGRSRWTEISRLFSIESTATVIFIATRLMNGVWDHARATHLGWQSVPFEGVVDRRTVPTRDVRHRSSRARGAGAPSGLCGQLADDHDPNPVAPPRDAAR